VLCQSVTNRPILDGVISDPCWETVPEMQLRSSRRTVSTMGSGFVVTTCDHEYLYLAARLERATTPIPKLATARTFDADHTGFDRLTIFLDTDRDYQVGYEITIDERGEVSESAIGWSAINARETSFTAKPTSSKRSITRTLSKCSADSRCSTPISSSSSSSTG
jgi:hypothetical protein